MLLTLTLAVIAIDVGFDLYEKPPIVTVTQTPEAP